MRKIAILPTGEWASVVHEDDVTFVDVTQEQYIKLIDVYPSQNAMLALTLEGTDKEAWFKENCSGD
jgi:hypothetical protein